MGAQAPPLWRALCYPPLDYSQIHSRPMGTLLAFLFLAALIALVVGLVNPARVKQPSRGRVWLVFGGASVVLLVLFSIVSPHTAAPVAATNTQTQAATDTPITVATTSPVVIAADADNDISTPTDEAVAQAAVAKAPGTIPVPSSGTKAGPAILYPNPTLTPGSVLSTDAATICASGYASSVRNVSTATKKKVYAEYGLTYPQASGAYEVDHFIPLEIGGSNDITNLWPEPAAPAPGFHQKDQFEDFEHDQICSGKISVQEAQSRMVSDWYYYWEVEVEGVTPGTTAPIQQTAAPAPTPQTTTTAPAASSTAAYYTSSYYSSKYYYPASCPAWKNLSSTYLVSFPSLSALLAKYPNQTLSPQCQ